MRRFVVLLVILALVAYCVPAFAVEKEETATEESMGTERPPAEGPMGPCPMMEEKEGGKTMGHHMKGMMAMKMMMPKEMVATNDGGVVVLAGHKLIKYDKNLNLVKEVEAKTGMSEKCVEMCKKMMEEKERPE